MPRLPKLPVSKWPKKRISDYAYKAMELQSMCGEEHMELLADWAMDRWTAGLMPKVELQQWAYRHWEYKLLNEE